MAVLLSHLVAVEKAYVAGDSRAIILEDDMSMVLSAYWNSSIPMLAEQLDREHPDWDLIILNCGSPDDDFAAWHRRPSTYKQTSSITGPLTAGLYSRNGMQKLLKAYKVADKFSCSGSIANRRGAIGTHGCLADTTFPVLLNTYTAWPPFFTYSLVNVEEGVRDRKLVRAVCNGRACSKCIRPDELADIKQQNIVSSLRWVISLYEYSLSGTISDMPLPWAAT